MSTYAYHQAVSQIKMLTPDEQIQLLEELQTVVRRHISPEPLQSIVELRGLGKEIWRDVDVEEYIRSMRQD